ncbi:MAG: motility associated factor glycosyltransferase family protein [bacterium]|nr:motility associated factor glycosyltransferase family protein [bacterium]
MKQTITAPASTQYEKNIALLARHQPDIAEQLQNTFKTISDSQLPEVIPSRKGNLTIKYNDSLLHSVYDPVTEAQRFVDGLSFDDHINIALLGLGMGYHLLELVKRSSHRDFILVVEENTALFKTFLEHVDLSGFYAHCKLYFAVHKSGMDIFRGLQGCGLTILANGITVIKHPATCKISPEYYQAVGEKIKDIFEWSRINTMSQITSSRQYAENIFENMPAYLATPGIERLFKAFTEFPCIIISAGPSLIKNIRFLREAQGKAVLVAVDTALHVLLKHSIQPDFVVSIDFTEHNNRYFNGIYAPDTALVVDPEVYPKIIRDYAGAKFMVSLPGKSLCDWLTAQVGSKGDMDKGLSVAHTAFLFALKLGTTPIGFVGQDLSFPGKMSHVRGSAMVRKNRVASQDSNTVSIKNIFGGTEQTNASMHVFLRHFEELLDKHPLPCFDLTEGGAYIQGAHPMPLKEFIMKYARQKRNIRTIIHTAYSNPCSYNAKNVHSSIDAATTGLKKTASLCEKGTSILKQLEQMFSTRNYTPQLTSKLKEWASISSRLNHERAILQLLGNNITDVMLLQAKKHSFTFDELDIAHTDGIRELIAKDTIIFSRIAEQCRAFVQKFNNFKQFVR